MIRNMGAGWAEIEIENFHGYPSYIDDVPVILLNAFIEYYENGESEIEFDEEGTEFILKFKDNKVEIIKEEDTDVLIKAKVNVDDLAKEAYYDIKNYLQEWIDFCFTVNEKEEIEIKNKLEENLGKIKSILNIE